MTEQKPHLAVDIDLDKAVWPAIWMPKLDGVRGINLKSTLTGRSLKQFKNKFVTERFSGEHTLGFDGELCLGNITAPRLCSETTGFVNRKTARPGKPTESDELVWWLFDYIAPHAANEAYHERLQMLTTLVTALNAAGHKEFAVVPWKLVHSREEFEAQDAWALENGYEGSIYRNMNAPHKSGRASTKLGAYMRLKQFVDFEGIVEGYEEAMENTNEAKTNELGRSERPTHQENMVPKGMVGGVKLRALADVIYRDKVLIAKDQLVDLGPGNMDHKERIEQWRAYKAGEKCWVGEVGKGKIFGHGQKDLPRFPTFIGLRAEEDMSEA